jgi:myo-inositol-1(or 4)-monophosphatase
MDLVALQAHLFPGIEAIGHEIWQRSAALHTLQVRSKAPGDVASDIDLWAEQSLRELLMQALPQADFLGEETGGPSEGSLQDTPTWIVDPIDGSANFVRGYPQWSISVALAVQREPVLGMIVDPSRQELFYATRGQGAWLKSRHGLQRLQVAPAREALQATVATVFPKPHAAFMETYLKELSAVMRAFGHVRRSGSMALELAYAAAGRVDAFWERGMAAWDAAAGALLIQEAGGLCQALDGQALLASRMIAAGSPNAVEALLAHLQP